MSASTFIVYCPQCKARVAANETGRAEHSGRNPEDGEPYGHRLQVGLCSSCMSLLAGESYQQSFEGYDSDYDVWSDVVRIFPEPAKTFTSVQIPNGVRESLAGVTDNPRYPASVVMRSSRLRYCRDES
jgi:hypothetical protein